jgi:hypothetical protein
MIDLINWLTKILHLVLMVFFLCVVFNSCWAWIAETMKSKTPRKNTQMD